MMSCTCRTNSLRIFVQSLTELRIADPSIRSVGLSRLASPIGFRQAPVYRSTRSFGSAPALYSFVHRRKEALLAAQSEDEPTNESIRPTADPINNDLPTPTPPAPEINFDAAKQNGAILDFSPESIDLLVANLDRTSLADHEAGMREPNASDAPDSPAPYSSRAKTRAKTQAKTQTKSQEKTRAEPKAPVAKSQLKRLKIVPKKPKKMTKEEKEDMPQWKIQKAALKEKFPEGWNPRKKLSPEAMDGIRDLHSRFPKLYTTPVLANHFEVSPEAIRRILKSKWTASGKEEEKRQERWFDRGKAIWKEMAARGMKPPRKWRREGIVREHHWNKKKGPRTEYPYVPDRESSPSPVPGLIPRRNQDQGQGRDKDQDQESMESFERKFAGALL